MSEEDLKIGRKNKGTVIDHIDAGYAITHPYDSLYNCVIVE